MSRVLFLGDLAGTGFGTVTRNLGRELLALGLDVRFMSLNEGAVEDLEEPFRSRTALIGDPDGWLAYPTDEETGKRTSARIEGMFTGSLFPDGWVPQSAIIVGDVGSLKISPVLGFLPRGFPAFHYVPIEGVGLPPSWGALWQMVRPVAMCEFGATEIEKVTGSRPPVVYHGVNSDDFWPVSASRPIVFRAGKELHVLRTKADCKAFFGAKPDRFWALRTDRHMPRKLYGSMLRIMADVLGAYPQVDFVYHCRTLDQGGDLSDERAKYPPVIRNRMISTGFHDKYGGAEPRILNILYNAADVYVTTSAEGFGLTIAEALACGVPVVGMDYSSVPEVIGPAGITVPVAHLLDNIYSYFWATPDERAFAKAVESLILGNARRRELGRQGPAHVAEHFRWDAAARQFADLIAEAVPAQEAVA